MTDKSIPLPDNELQRIIGLSDLDMDFIDMEGAFNDLTLLATKITGMQTSLINIIDAHTQWTIAKQGIDVKQVPRADSVCHYTTLGDKYVEIQDLRLDARFSYRDFVARPDGFRYYFGIPLRITEGINIGTLCVLDTKVNSLSPEEIELLKLVSQTVVERLKSMTVIRQLNEKLHELEASKRKAAHDIRGPLAGIVGLSSLLKEQGTSVDAEELSKYVSMIYKSGQSLLDLADEILTDGVNRSVIPQGFDLTLFSEKLTTLYQPQAEAKHVELEFMLEPCNQIVPFSKNMLMQIAGNLISNAIKFTSAGGKVQVKLGMILRRSKVFLRIHVSDTGSGMDEKSIQRILLGKAETTPGTIGERGYGLGLSLVKHLVELRGGKIKISSIVDQGSVFVVTLPQYL